MVVERGLEMTDDNKTLRLYPWQEKMMNEPRSNVFPGGQPPNPAVDGRLMYILSNALHMYNQKYFKGTEMPRTSKLLILESLLTDKQILSSSRHVMPTERKLDDIISDFRHRPLSHKLIEEIQSLQGDIGREFFAVMARYTAEDDKILTDWIEQGGIWLIVAPERNIFEGRVSRIGYKHADLRKLIKPVHFVERGTSYREFSPDDTKVMVMADCWMGNYNREVHALRDRFEVVYEYRT